MTGNAASGWESAPWERAMERFVPALTPDAPVRARWRFPAGIDSIRPLSLQSVRLSHLTGGGSEP